MNPRFSVVIPAFNSAATLARAIESVRAQSWPAHEIIVVDDGSTDATAEVAGRFEDVRLLRQKNSGVATARNAGAAAARGDWLAFLDADDWYTPERLRLHAEWIVEETSLDCLTGDYEYRDEAGACLGTSMAQHASGRMMLDKAAGAVRVMLETPDELAAFVADHGVWVYGLLFAIVFMETGFVVTPFLPGDSLLFVAGAIAAAGGMDIPLLMATLVTAALNGSLKNADFRTDPYFGFAVPTSVPGVEPHLLNPIKTWANKAEFDKTARELVAMFQKNFAKFESHVTPDVKAAAPEVRIAAE